ncbi:MAG: hypothetical protein ABFC80_01320, partial [Coriobacteriales bacterium]
GEDGIGIRERFSNVEDRAIMAEYPTGLGGSRRRAAFNVITVQRELLDEGPVRAPHEHGAWLLDLVGEHRLEVLAYFVCVRYSKS